MCKETESKLKSEMKNLNKKIEALNKANRELKANLSNQTAISDLYLENSRKLEEEVQQLTDEIKFLKNLLNNYQRNETDDNNREIVFVRQNDEISYNTNFHNLISKLKELFECPLSLAHLEKPII